VRKVFAVAAALMLTATAFAAAQAQTFPNRPIRIVIGFGPGGFADITMRLLGQKMTEITGQQVVIENRPSAGGMIAAAAVSSTAPDGYTMFVLSSAVTIAQSLLKTMPFDPRTAFAPVSTAAYFDLLILTRGDGPLRSIEDVLAAAKRDPTKFNVGTVVPGSTQNVTAELLRSVTGIPMTIVPYRSTPEVLTALLRDDVQIAVESYAALKAPIDAGQIRAVAGTGDVRSPKAPDVATLKEKGINAEVVGWNALVVPAQTPPDIVALLNKHVNAAVTTPEFTQRMLDFGTIAKGSTPDELRARISSDIDKWAAVIKQAGIEAR
jgi:tripartite-type tricarboxylate transporter receptor subunit TctC